MNAYSNVAIDTFPSRDELVAENTKLVKRIACHLAARLPPAVEMDDLLQAGMIGLLEAAASFDGGRGASFETWAGIRIRGAMLDEVRKVDWTPRSVHQKWRRVSEAMRDIEACAGRPAEGREIAAQLGLTIDAYHDILRDAAGCRLFSLEEAVDNEAHSNEPSSPETALPDRQLETTRFRQRLVEAIGRLPERERLVLSLYYERELNLKEIGAVLEVSESRICQIHGQALIRLRSMIEA